LVWQQGGRRHPWHIKMYSLDKHIISLLRSEPFFAAVSTQVEKIASKTVTSTMGVRYNKSLARYELYYNPDFVKNLSDDEVIGILMHEFYHIILLHVTSRADEDRHAKWNICTDLAINSLIPRRMLPAAGHFPGEGAFKHIPSGKSADWYMNNLEIPERHAKFIREQAGDHGGWADNDAVSDIKAEQKARNILKSAYEQCEEDRAWGSVSDVACKRLEKNIYLTNAPEKALRFFIRNTVRGERSSSIKKINKRYPYIHSGKKYSRVANIAVAVDQSRSVDNELLKRFFSFLEKLARKTEFTVIPFDTKVNEKDVFIWKKGTKINWERAYEGGTDFNCVVEYLKKNRFDGVIMLTDLCGEKPKNSPCKRIWVTNELQKGERFFDIDEKIIFL